MAEEERTDRIGLDRPPGRQVVLHEDSSGTEEIEDLG